MKAVKSSPELVSDNTKTSISPKSVLFFHPVNIWNFLRPLDNRDSISSFKAWNSSEEYRLVYVFFNAFPPIIVTILTHSPLKINKYICEYFPSWLFIRYVQRLFGKIPWREDSNFSRYWRIVGYQNFIRETQNKIGKIEVKKDKHR